MICVPVEIEVDDESILAQMECVTDAQYKLENEMERAFGEAYARGILKTLGLSDHGSIKQEPSGSASESLSAAESGSAAECPFVVKLLDNMNIRETPSASGKIVKADTDPKGARKGVKYTIVKVSGNWGLLKSYESTGKGWINISEKYAEKV